MTDEDHRTNLIALPTPYPVGRVNCYLLPGTPTTLIDCGVKSERSLTTLDESLHGHSLSIEALDRIVLTHRHFDHAGAAPELARRSGASLLCHRGSLRDEVKGRQQFLDLIATFGAPTSVVEGLESAWTMGDRFGDHLRNASNLIELKEGSRIESDSGQLEVLETPGHSPGHLSFVDRERELLFCGDLLLAHITSNPLPHFDDDQPNGRQRSLALYIRSLEAVEALGPLRGAPGHGKPIEDTAEAAVKARKHIEKRSNKVLELVRNNEGKSIFALATTFFWEDNVLGQSLAFCEILAHVDLLEERGILELDQSNGIPRLFDSATI